MSAIENYWEEEKNTAGMGQGEEDVGKSLRKLWTGCLISLSIARCSPVPVGPRAGLGQKDRGQERRLLYPASLPRSSHTLFLRSCVL